MSDLSGGSILGSSPYNSLIFETAAQVGAVLVPLGIADATVNRGLLVILRNSSAAGRNIRIGANPSFTPGSEAGLMLEPGDILQLVNVNTNLAVIANGASGVLDILIFTRVVP